MSMGSQVLRLRARRIAAVVVGSMIGLSLMVGSAFAQASTVDQLQDAVEPIFTDLKTLALWAIALVLSVSLVGIGLRFIMGYVKKIRT
jgi:hypothetical protein